MATLISVDDAPLLQSLQDGQPQRTQELMPRIASHFIFHARFQQTGTPRTR